MAALRGGAVPAAAGTGVGGSATGTALRGLAGGGAPREPPLRAGSPLQVGGGGGAAGRAVTRGGRGGSRAGGGTTCAGSGPCRAGGGRGAPHGLGSLLPQSERGGRRSPAGIGWWRLLGSGAAVRSREPPGWGSRCSPREVTPSLRGVGVRGAPAVFPLRGPSIPAPPSATCGRGGGREGGLGRGHPPVSVAGAPGGWCGVAWPALGRGTFLSLSTGG